MRAFDFRRSFTVLSSVLWLELNRIQPAGVHQAPRVRPSVPPPPPYNCSPVCALRMSVCRVLRMGVLGSCFVANYRFPDSSPVYVFRVPRRTRNPPAPVSNCPSGTRTVTSPVRTVTPVRQKFANDVRQAYLLPRPRPRLGGGPRSDAARKPSTTATPDAGHFRRSAAKLAALVSVAASRRTNTFDPELRL